MQYFTPDIVNSTTHVTAESTVDAPISIVWKTLLDFESYEKWNPFVRSQLVTDSKYIPLSVQPEPAEGQFLLMKVQIPAPADGTMVPVSNGLTRSEEVITFVDEENPLVGWKQTSYSDWFLRAYRRQEMKEVLVDGNKMIRYCTVKTFNGPLAWFIRFFLWKNLTTSFEAMAMALKACSEQVARAE